MCDSIIIDGRCACNIEATKTSGGFLEEAKKREPATRQNKR
jgi:hypothetical protein